MDATRSPFPLTFDPSPSGWKRAGVQTPEAPPVEAAGAVRSSPLPLDPQLRARLTALFQEGREMWDRFEVEVRQKKWHPFIPGNYERILEALLAQTPVRPGASLAPRRFLEWGSATGVVTIMADLLGFEACGIELDADLVRVARGLAERHGSGARFSAGSFLPEGYRWTPLDGDGRSGTLGDGPSAYPDLGYELADFDLVYGYPWDGERALMRDLMQRSGSPGATLLVHTGTHDIRVCSLSTAF